MFKAKKWKQNNCLTCFLSSCLLLTSSSFVSYANYNVDYSTLSRSKLGTAEADDIFNSCENEENIFLKNNYAPLYFKNLRTNFGNNVFNSCTIALVFDNNILHPDYHFYRQNADGTWSHKLGQSGIPTNLDGDGQVIYDPENCAQEYDIVYDDFGVQGSHNYSVFVGFYAVKTTTIIGGNRQ